ncbi:hypothetical protein [Tenacibaculum sp.]|uniref:hypothetical protein n=1 Tax=Tenacibaculum sp. TaxID=1906242 RepID=UPI003D131964
MIHNKLIEEFTFPKKAHQKCIVTFGTFKPTQTKVDIFSLILLVMITESYFVILEA